MATVTAFAGSTVTSLFGGIGLISVALAVLGSAGTVSAIAGSLVGRSRGLKTVDAADTDLGVISVASLCFKTVEAFLLGDVVESASLLKTLAVAGTIAVCSVASRSTVVTIERLDARTGTVECSLTNLLSGADEALSGLAVGGLSEFR